MTKKSIRTKYDFNKILSLAYILKQYVQVSDDYVVNLVAKNGNSTVVFQGLSYNRGIDISNYSGFENRHISFYTETANEDRFWEKIKEYKLFPNPKDHKILFIFRDPVKRLLSAKNTGAAWYFDKNMDEYLDIIREAFEDGKPRLIDQHVYPQFPYLIKNNLWIEDIHLFIDLEDYQEFCIENNIPWILANKNTKQEYLNTGITKEQEDRIKSLYADDYKMIDLIKNSGKLYKPKKNKL